MKKIKKPGSSNTIYSKAEKIQTLKCLQATDFNMAKTSQRTGVSIDSIRRWRYRFGDEVFSKQPSIDVLQRKVDTAAIHEIAQISLQTKKVIMVNSAADLLIERVQDPVVASQIPTRDLIELFKLKTETQGEKGKADSSFDQAIERFIVLKKKEKRTDMKDAGTL